MIRSITIWSLALLAGGVLAAAETVAPPPPPPAESAEPAVPSWRPERKNKGDRPKDPRRFPGHYGWRAFGRLSEGERQKLMELQRTDPESFQQKLRELGEALYKQEAERTAELRKLVASFRAAGSDAERNRLREKIMTMAREDFQQRLEENRRQLQEMKRRAAQFEKELDKRAANADEAVAARVEALLSGLDEVRAPLPQPPPPPPAPAE